MAHSVKRTTPTEATPALDELVPPADFALETDDPFPPFSGAFRHARVSPSRTVGRVLGGGDRAAAERWQHLAGDAEACQAIKTSVVQHHISCHPEVLPIEDDGERGRAMNRLGGRLCTRCGSKALRAVGVVPG